MAIVVLFSPAIAIVGSNDAELGPLWLAIAVIAYTCLAFVFVSHIAKKHKLYCAVRYTVLRLL